MEKRNLLKDAQDLLMLEIAKGRKSEILDMSSSFEFTLTHNHELEVRVLDDKVFELIYDTWAPLTLVPDILIRVLLPFILGGSYRRVRQVAPNYLPFPGTEEEALDREFRIVIDEVMTGLHRWGLVPNQFSGPLRWSTSLPVPHFLEDAYISYDTEKDLSLAWQCFSPLVRDRNVRTTILTLLWDCGKLRGDEYGSAVIESISDLEEQRTLDAEEDLAKRVLALEFDYWDGSYRRPIFTFRSEVEDFPFKYVSVVLTEGDNRAIDVALSNFHVADQFLNKGERIDLKSSWSFDDIRAAILKALAPLGYTEVRIDWHELSITTSNVLTLNSK